MYIKSLILISELKYNFEHFRVLICQVFQGTKQFAKNEKKKKRKEKKFAKNLLYVNASFCMQNYILLIFIHINQ